jgi:protein O-mannosyl-transferase
VVTRRPTHRTNAVIIALAIAVVTAVAFLPVLGNGFVNWDDDVLVTRNPFVRALSFESLSLMFSNSYFHSYTPLALVSHAVDVAIWGMSPRGHHLTSVLLHGINAALFFLLALSILRGAQPGIGDQRAEGGRLIGAAVAALAFALHPMKVESVAWVSDRKDLLSGLFALVTTLCYVAYLRRRRSAPAVRWYLGALVAFVFALLSKSAILMLPLALGVLDAAWLSAAEIRSSWKRLVAEKIPFLLLSTAAGFVALRSAPHDAVNYALTQFSGFERLLLPFHTVIFPLGKLVWPFSLGPVYDPPGSATLALTVLLCAGITLGVVWVFRRVPAPLLAWLGYGLLMVPVMAGSSSGIQPWGDRYFYVPGIPLFLLAASGAAVLAHRLLSSPRRRRMQRVATAVAGLLLVGMGVLSFHQSGLWYNSETLWTHAATVAPNSPIPPNNLGIAYYERQEYARAIASYERAVTLEPRYAEGFYNAGLACEAEGRSPEALSRYSRAIEANPGYVPAYINKGNLVLAAGKSAEAMDLYERALAIDPGSADAYYHTGLALMRGGKGEEAMDSFRAATRRNPYLASAWNNIGVLSFGRGDHAGAREAWTRVVALRPEDADAYYNLGVLSTAEGDSEAAIKAYSRALVVRPAFVGAEMNLGIVYVFAGRYDEGIRHYLHALTIDSTSPALYYNLGVAYYNKGDRLAALEQFKRVLDLDTSNAAAAYNLGTVYADLGRQGDARAAMARAARLGSGEARVYLGREEHRQ